MSGIWKTKDGRSLEMRWMDSQHVANSANLVLRQNRHTCSLAYEQICNFCLKIGGIFDETARRKLDLLANENGEWQFAAVPARESIEDLCAMNACLDAGELVVTFFALEELVKAGHKKYEPLLAEAVRLRLTR